MFAECTTKLTNLLVEQGDCELENKEIVAFGIQSAIEMGYNIITSLVLGMMFGLFIENIIFLTAFSYLRSYAGGYHCKNRSNCYLLSVCAISFVLLLVYIIPIDVMPQLTFWNVLFSVPVILKFAPLDTITKQLDEDERVYFRKQTKEHLIQECLVCIVCFILNWTVLGFVISLAIGLSAVVLLAELGCKFHAYS